MPSNGLKKKKKTALLHFPYQGRVIFLKVSTGNFGEAAKKWFCICSAKSLIILLTLSFLRIQTNIFSWPSCLSFQKKKRKPFFDPIPGNCELPLSLPCLLDLFILVVGLFILVLGQIWPWVSTFGSILVFGAF